MNDKPEHTADISAELRTLSRSAECCELQPKVFGKPIAQYLAELADRIDAATASDAMRIKEAIAYLERVGETEDGRLHFGDLMRIENAKVMLKIVIAFRKAEPTAHNGGSAPQTVYNMAAMYMALVAVKKLFDGRIHFGDIASIGIAKAELCKALEEPPRNCDVGTADEQAKRFEQFCGSVEGLCDKCELDKPGVVPTCGVLWSQWTYKAPAQKGGAK